MSISMPVRWWIKLGAKPFSIPAQRCLPTEQNSRDAKTRDIWPITQLSENLILIYNCANYTVARVEMPGIEGGTTLVKFRNNGNVLSMPLIVWCGPESYLNKVEDKNEMNEGTEDPGAEVITEPERNTKKTHEHVPFSLWHVIHDWAWYSRRCC